MMPFLAKCDQRSSIILLVISQLTFLQLLFTVYIVKKCIWLKQNTTMTSIMYTSDLNIRAHDCNI